jgi:hypothetical protein
MKTTGWKRLPLSSDTVDDQQDDTSASKSSSSRKCNIATRVLLGLSLGAVVVLVAMLVLTTTPNTSREEVTQGLQVPASRLAPYTGDSAGSTVDHENPSGPSGSSWPSGLDGSGVFAGLSTNGNMYADNNMFRMPVRFAEGVNISVSRARLRPDNSILNGQTNMAFANVTLTWLTTAASVNDIKLMFYGDRLYTQIWNDYKARRITNVDNVANNVRFYHCWPLVDHKNTLQGTCLKPMLTSLTSNVKSSMCHITNTTGALASHGLRQVTCTIPIRAPPRRTGLFNLAFRVVDMLYSDDRYPQITNHLHGLDDIAYAELEVTCSDGLYCNGEERFVGLKCQAPGSNPQLPCFKGEGDCFEYECLEKNGGQCSIHPIYTFPGSPPVRRVLHNESEVLQYCGANCDISRCNPRCKKKAECGKDGCLLGCYRDDNLEQRGFTYNATIPEGWVRPFNMNPNAPLYHDGMCTGLYRQHNGTLRPTTCIESLCVIPETDILGSCNNPFPLFALELDTEWIPMDTRDSSNLSSDLNDPNTGPVRETDLIEDKLTIPPQGFEGRFIFDSNTYGVEQVTPECGTVGVREMIVAFKTPPNWRNNAATAGFEIRSYGQNGEILDTLLELRYSCSVQLTYPTGTCSDDASPPSDFGSRLFGRLEPDKEYALVVSGYDDKGLGHGYLEVWISGEDCTPQCEGKTCGSDGCTATRPCGSCGEGDCCYACGMDDICRFGQSYCLPGRVNTSIDSFTCEANQDWTCVPDCKGRNCGPSLNRCPEPNSSRIQMCGPREGDCKKDQMCDILNGRCVPIKPCDGLAPECTPNSKKGRLVNSKNAYCANDCKFHQLEEDMVDLVMGDTEFTVPGLKVVWTSVSPESPALFEGCIQQSGVRALLRFDTWVFNYGTNSYNPPDPSDRPDHFEFSFTHAHYHFLGFARFDLFTRGTREPLVLGGKLAYCMETTLFFMRGPRMKCTTDTDCDNQGIEVGGGDLYSSDLDCQWLDVTELITATESLLHGKTGVDRVVEFVAEANFDRLFPELTFDNNRVSIPMYIPTAHEVNPAGNGTATVGAFFDYEKYLCQGTNNEAVRQLLNYSGELYKKIGCPDRHV